MDLQGHADQPSVSHRGLFTSFWVTVAICLALLSFVFLQNAIEITGQVFKLTLFTGVVLLSVSGGGLIYFAATSRLQRVLRRTMLWTGISAAGIPICAVLHNLVYGLLILLFGKEFWGQGGDEPVFFILAIIVFPLLFLVSTVWSIWLIIHSSRSAPPSAPPPTGSPESTSRPA